jgi:hypothetical protein
VGDFPTKVSFIISNSRSLPAQSRSIVKPGVDPMAAGPLSPLSREAGSVSRTGFSKKRGHQRTPLMAAIDGNGRIPT